MDEKTIQVPLPQVRANRSFAGYVIEPFKQIKMGLYVYALSMVFLVLIAWLFVNSFNEQYKHVMEIFSVVDPGRQWDVVTSDVFKANLIKLILLLLGYSIILFAIIFRMTHRYYGPIVSIQRFVQQMTDGDYRKRISIRRNDELHDLAMALNHMAATLETRHPETAQQFDRRNK